MSGRVVRQRTAPVRKPLGQIEKLLIENFKSYEGSHEIGPFDKFTCVIGPNGSGKSNVMDAISFCLGIKAKHLRGDKLKDLVYRREEEDPDANVRRASATMVFRTADGGVLHFGRAINSKGQGTYMYGAPSNVQSVTYDEFLNHLACNQIFVKARNFLVFQGDVMELARRQGGDLTTMLETISGSDLMKEEYDRLSKELDIMEETARMHFQHRREVEGTVAILDKQRREVERYHELRRLREHLGVEVLLFRIYCAEQELQRERSSNEDVRCDLAAVEAELKTKRRDAEETEAQRKVAETETDQATSQHFVLSSNLEQLKPEISNCRKQAAHWSKKLKEREDMILEEEKKHESFLTTIKQTRQDREKAEAEISKLKARSMSAALNLTPHQRTEYEDAVAKTDAVNLRTREQIREAEAQLSAVVRDLEADRIALRDLEDNRARNATKQSELAHDTTSVELELENVTTLLEQRRRQVTTVEEEVKKFTLFRDSLVEEQRSLRYQLDLAKSRRERLDQVDARHRMAEELRENFSDAVVGRLSEMVLPTQKRFDLPLQMSMGSMAEAFIVTNAAAGRECVRYLKERRIGQETFLPLDRMVEPNPGPLHLLTANNQARRLATMCVQHNDKFLERNPRWQAEGPNIIERAVNFLLNGTVIVDDLSEAKTTAYVDARRRGLMPRVVTLDGEVIAPNGNMSVQSISSFGRVEFGGADQLHEIKVQEQKLLQVEKDLATLSEELARRTQRDSEAREHARNLENQHLAAEHRLKALRMSATAEQRVVSERAARIEELHKNVEQQSARLVELEQRKDALETELLKVGKKHFEKLNKELGVRDVRELAQKENREKRKIRQDCEQYEDFVRTLINEERALEQKMKGSSKLKGLKQDCEQYQRDIEATTKKLQDLEQREKMFTERCDKGRDRMRKVNAAKEKLEHEVKVKRAELLRMRALVDEMRKRMKKQMDKVRVLLTYRCRVFRESSERQIAIPLAHKDSNAFELILSREVDLDDLPFPELEAACAAIKVDFTLLPDSRKNAASQTKVYDAKGIEADYDAQIVDICKELDGLNPNMHAVDQYKTETVRLKEIQQKADEASLKSQRLAREFEVVKTERLARFTKCYKHVEAKVHPFYRSLTSYDGNDGGSAYLDLDDAEEPYNGGITFTACPPGKRFFPMELLSGGEKSMASMALLFAMHSYQPPPFMVLDEVDAPFDRKNTQSLVDYLKQLEFQCLVISLKDTFFSHSDAIIGIYKDKEVQSSGALTLPLKALGQESAPPETEVPPVEDLEIEDID